MKMCYTQKMIMIPTIIKDRSGEHPRKATKTPKPNNEKIYVYIIRPNHNISIISQNANGPNSPIKR